MTDSSLVFLKPTRDGVLLEVHVQPNAKRSAIVGRHGDRLKVALKQPPQDGKANAELIELFAEELGLPRAAIELVRGAASRQKTLQIKGMTADQLHSALGPSMPATGKT